MNSPAPRACENFEFLDTNCEWYINILAIVVQVIKRTDNIFLNPIILTKISNFAKTEVSLVQESGTFVGCPLPKTSIFVLVTMTTIHMQPASLINI